MMLNLLGLQLQYHTVIPLKAVNGAIDTSHKEIIQRYNLCHSPGPVYPPAEVKTKHVEQREGTLNNKISKGLPLTMNIKEEVLHVETTGSEVQR